VPHVGSSTAGDPSNIAIDYSTARLLEGKIEPAGGA
jgi:hypothetical protein